MAIYSPQEYCLTIVGNLGYFGGDCLYLAFFMKKQCVRKSKIENIIKPY